VIQTLRWFELTNILVTQTQWSHWMSYRARNDTWRAIDQLSAEAPVAPFQNECAYLCAIGSTIGFENTPTLCWALLWSQV